MQLSWAFVVTSTQNHWINIKAQENVWINIKIMLSFGIGTDHSFYYKIDTPILIN